MSITTKERLLRSTVLAGVAALTMGGAPVFAQETDEPEQTAEESPAAEDTIVVTGSRIARTGFDTTQPSEIIGSQEIELRGYTNAADAVLDIPGVFGNTPIGNQGSSGVGQNLPNLFGLGTNRTLTLIDGRRFVSSNSPVGGSGNPGSQVDLNNIPVAMIERVEVVKVGGAAVYGSDAVAGVVNYILRDDYEGFEIGADYSQWGEDNIADEYSIRALMGGNFDNGRGNIVASIEFNETSPVLEGDIDDLAEGWSRFTPTAANRVVNPDTGTAPGSQTRVVPAATAGILSFSGLLTPGPAAVTNIGLGRFPDGAFYQFDPSGSGNLVPFDAGNPTGNLVWGSGGDGLRLENITPLRSPFRRMNFSTFVDYQINDYVNFSMNVFANQFEATEPVNQPFYASGLFGATSGSLYFPADYAYLNQSVRDTLAANGLNGFYLQKGFLDLGQKDIFNETTVMSYNFALDGMFSVLERDVTWELAYQTGSSSIVSQTGDLSEDRFFASIDVGINPATGQVDCRFNYDPTFEAPLAGGNGVIDDVGALGEECVPYNPFEGATQENVDYLIVNRTAVTEIEQEIVSGFLTSDIFALPAGNLGFATGFEYRREFADYRPGAGNQLNITRDGGGSPTTGEYFTTDVYAETYIPVLGGGFNPIPFIDYADIEASYRLMNNTRAGVDEAWAVGLSMGILEDLNFRANVARTVRAPAVTELFLPRVQSSQFAADPCSANNLNGGPRPAVRAANCAAEGLPPTFISQAQNATVSGFNGGNPQLNNETADSYNFGLVFSPRWVDGLTLSVDYINIAIEDAITSFTLTQIMQACYDSTNYPNSFCNAFTRLPNGQLPSINAFTSGYVNAAIQEFDSVELAARYQTELNDVFFLNQIESDLGTFDATLRVYNVQTNTTSSTGFDYNDTVGQRSNPNWRGDVRAQWYRGPVTAFVDVEYTGSGLVSKFAVPYQYIDETGNPYYNFDSYTTVDIGGSYDWNNVTFRASIQNVTDEGYTNAEKAHGYYNIGRIFNVGVTARF